MVYTIGITISVFLAAILFTKKNKTIADKVLAIWLFVIACHLLIFTSFILKAYLQFPYLLGFEKPIALLHGPFVYIYTLSLTSPSKMNKWIFLNFIPFVISLISIIPFLLLNPDKKIIVYQSNGTGYELLLNITFVATFLSGVIYSVLSFQAILRHKKNIKEKFSFSEKINLQWLLHLILGISCIWLFVAFGNDNVIFTAAIIYVIYIGVFGIRQGGIFNNTYAILYKTEEVSPDLGVVKYENSKLTDEQVVNIHEQLCNLMNREKLYLTPELTLSMVSEQLGIHPHTLSEVINRAEEKKFFDYINTLRVEEFKKRVSNLENQKFTLVSLAYDCGFNSKTSFNRNFKNITGKSPSEYIKSIVPSKK